MAVRSSVNQVVQLGKETSQGSAVAAGKLLVAWTWTFGEKAATKQFRGTGRQYPSASSLLSEYAGGKISGVMDYAHAVYPLSSLWGAATVALHGASSTANDWTWKPALTGAYAATAQTYTLQNGDANDAEQYAFCAFQNWGYTFTRKQEAQVSGDWIGQTFSDGQALTSSPTEIEQLPAVGANFNVYLDSTSGGLGGTLLSNPLKVDYKASGYNMPYWPINRANSSFTSIIDGEKKHELKLTLAAGSTEIANRANYLQTGSRAYVRVDGQGATIDAGHSVVAEMKHDMACFVSDMAEFSDVDGVYAVEYTLQVAEDTSWTSLAGGTSQVMVLTNLLTAL